MFFQRDYILRMIEMMGDLMRRIKELMSGLSRLNLLDEACRTHCGLPLDTAEKLTIPSLHELLQPMPRLFMSEILYIKATTLSLLPTEQEALLHKSLHLLASLWEEGPLCELRADRLLEMKERVRPLLSSPELMDCARFFQEAERYDLMEDALFQAVEKALAEGEPGLAQAQAETGAAMLALSATAATQALIFAHTSGEELLSSATELRNMVGRDLPL